jgi:hypothetical protein
MAHAKSVRHGKIWKSTIGARQQRQLTLRWGLENLGVASGGLLLKKGEQSLLNAKFFASLVIVKRQPKRAVGKSTAPLAIVEAAVVEFVRERNPSSKKLICCAETSKETYGPEAQSSEEDSC